MEVNVFMKISKFLLWVRATLSVFPALFCFSFFDQLLSGSARNAGITTQELMGIASLSILNALIFPSLAFLAGVMVLHPARAVATSPATSFKFLLIETLRAWGKIFQGSLLLLIPGVVSYFRLCWVPYVVLCDPGYSVGKIDAIARSKEIFSISRMKSFLVVVLFNLVMAFILTGLFDEWRNFSLTPLAATGFVFVDSIMFIFSIAVMVSIFEKANRKVSGGA